MKNPRQPTARAGEIVSTHGDALPEKQGETLASPGTTRGLNGLGEVILMVLLGLLSGSLVAGGVLAFLWFR